MSVAIVRVIGGLGNQLFQYAFGQHLQHDHGYQTVYDISDFAHYRTHAGGAAIERTFDVQMQTAGPDLLRAAPMLARSRVGRKIAARLPGWLPIGFPTITDRNHASFAQSAMPAPVRYFDGYWQKAAFAGSLPNTLAFRDDVRAASRAIMADLGLDGHRDVAIHVRRGDYLKHPGKCHLPLSETGYYLLSARKLPAVAGRRFVIFSDDIAGLRTGPLSALDPIYVDASLSPSQSVDLCLIAGFRTFIMSASSFSWWGAALNRHPDAEIYCPSPWVKLPFASDPHVSAEPLPTWQLLDTVPDQMRGFR